MIEESPNMTPGCCFLVGIYSISRALLLVICQSTSRYPLFALSPTYQETGTKWASSGKPVGIWWLRPRQPETHQHHPAAYRENVYEIQCPSSRFEGFHDRRQLLMLINTSISVGHCEHYPRASKSKVSISWPSRDPIT